MSARISLVVTFTGPDRPGIVSALSHSVASHGGNWEKSRMARLSGRFAGILQVSVEEAHAEALTRELERVEGLSVRVDRDPPSELPLGEQRLHLELTGADRPGIVRDVTGALARRGVSIVDLSTESVSAPMSGEALFKATADLRCTSHLDLELLRREVESRLTDDLMVDLTLVPPHG
ncbi:ACT domain-containing protein [Aggregicoccus sp. 17bor-14]|uniref:glycine cleavage system protein R n=1 Tax=Myxococcaceae TaxID=31 RepID=UPI00129D1B04|nr:MULTISPECIES: ACT domain-containing protein [Myxococcaceae]MBF5046558.1 ACT domain-containing protein [Simulacricoccus sp. 17bor-14]MRI92269.1 ACT domain-containing protein [Aggregicoccus sp. 17bor-14]